jgi:hypothetical protein
MNPKSTGAVSSCLIWIIVFGVISSCLVPLGMIVGGATSASNFAMQTLAPLICPEGTTADSYSYPTTREDEFGNTQPSTAYELHCVDASGTVVKEDPVLYAFLWMGIIVVIGLVLAAGLAFLLAAPAGVLISRMLDRAQRPPFAQNIEPR